jgi:hypothetical protein
MDIVVVTTGLYQDHGHVRQYHHRKNPMYIFVWYMVMRNGTSDLGTQEQYCNKDTNVSLKESKSCLGIPPNGFYWSDDDAI